MHISQATVDQMSDLFEMPIEKSILPDSAKAPYTILSMKPVPADDNHVSNLDI
jgi:hypothetical protein